MLHMNTFVPYLYQWLYLERCNILHEFFYIPTENGGNKHGYTVPLPALPFPGPGFIVFLDQKKNPRHIPTF
jgi:hypothetical protein